MVPLGREAEVIERVDAFTVSESCRVAVWLALSAACTVKVTVPAADGVPEIKPAALIERPAGRLPEVMVHETGASPPELPSAAEYGVPTPALFSVAVVMESGAGGVSGSGVSTIIPTGPQPASMPIQTVCKTMNAMLRIPLDDRNPSVPIVLMRFLMKIFVNERTRRRHCESSTLPKTF